MTRENLLDISLSTLIETSSLLGQHLDDRSSIRDAHEVELVDRLQAETSRVLSSTEQEPYYFFGSLDFLMTGEGDNAKFQAIEFNGTGMAGVSNILTRDFNAILHELSRVPAFLTDEIPIILVPFSGSRALKSPGSSSLVYEKILYAQAIKQGLEKRHGSASIISLENIIEKEQYRFDKPCVVLGYLKDLRENIIYKNGRVCLLGHPISAAMHDAFCDNTKEQFLIDDLFQQFLPINRSFSASSDKGITYQWINDYLQHEALENRKYRYIKDKIQFCHAENRDELITHINQQLLQGHKVVIKPHASGLGRGIEFFVNSDTPQRVSEKVDASIIATQRFYGVEHKFPYTVCEFMDTNVISIPNHPLQGHKFELRIMVYRSQNKLIAFPSIVKIATKPYNADHAERLMLLNNIAASKQDTLKFMFPLSNLETLNTIGVSEAQLAELCHFSTHLVGFILDKMSEPSTCALNASTTSLPTSR